MEDSKALHIVYKINIKIFMTSLLNLINDTYRTRHHIILLLNLLLHRFDCFRKDIFVTKYIIDFCFQKAHRQT